MIIERTERFKRAYKKLDEAKKQQVVRALGLLATDLRHPSLQVKRVQGTARIWEARASLSLRITFELQGGGILLRNVGEHDATLQRP
jgi:mRNA-degrading endonuclease RelE of RelBE toxin-antitoxin system